MAEFTRDYNLSNIRLRIEYNFDNISRVDKELELVMTTMDDIPNFSNSEKNISLKKEIIKEYKPVAVEEITITDKATETITADPAIDVIRKIVKAIENEDYLTVRSYFTDEGYEMFTRIISYGTAKLLDQGLDFELIVLDDRRVVRSLKMKFDFPRNDRTFIEDVNFVFNKDNKVEALNFGLGRKAIQDIANKPEKFGSLAERYHLINFMENYKTAYCLERLDFIESIFADNALIIVGSVVKQGDNIGEMYNVLGGDRVRYLEMKKHEYIERLSNIFRANEFVNIQFENNEVRKVSGDEKIYGIQIKQNYYSTTYGDEGYLFLMFDLSDTTQPQIYVRTWQPEKNPDGSIIGLTDFHF
ncbi:MAG: hypothetical protein JXQ65_11715 [Candidatus Marinimicrobia bacterium]|nr:hypothetical protein [Candidatus Neomarinimicrobiota bacterium]